MNAWWNFMDFVAWCRFTSEPCTGSRRSWSTWGSIVAQSEKAAAKAVGCFCFSWVQKAKGQSGSRREGSWVLDGTCWAGWSGWGFLGLHGSETAYHPTRQGLGQPKDRVWGELGRGVGGSPLPFWGSGLGRIKLRIASIGVDSQVMTHGFQLVITMGSARIAIVSPCRVISWVYDSTNLYQSQSQLWLYAKTNRNVSAGPKTFYGN